MKQTRSQNRIILFAALLAVTTLLAACSGGLRSQYKRGTQYVFEGEIDNIIVSETSYDKQPISVTSVGFSTGQGVTLVGVHPGLTKGKSVKVSAEYFTNSRGTDLFRMVNIEQKVTAPVVKAEVGKSQDAAETQPQEK